MKKKYYCIDCQKEVSQKRTKRCRSCENKRRWNDKKYRLNICLKLKGNKNSSFGKSLEDLHGKNCQCSFCNQKRGKGYGNCNPNYIDGRTDLNRMIRNLDEMSSWRTQILKQDNYICQECGSHNHLEAHHIKSFSMIFSEFLQQYSQFSPIEDKETLVRLAFSYQPFWDIDNGKTLCEKCHGKIKVGIK